MIRQESGPGRFGTILSGPLVFGGGLSKNPPSKPARRGRWHVAQSGHCLVALRMSAFGGKADITVAYPQQMLTAGVSRYDPHQS